MTLSVGILGPAGPRIPSPRTPRVEDYDSSSSTESADTARNFAAHSRPRTAFAVSTSSPGSPVFLFPPTGPSGRSSRSSTSSNTPVPSRSVSPLPQFYSSGPSSSCTSDTDSEPHSPLLGRQYRNPQTPEDQRRRWWTLGTSNRRRRKRHGRFLRLLKRGMRRLVRHPLFPSQPITIILTLLFLTGFAIFLTLLIIHILDPDKEPLPWRAYCSAPSSSSPPDFSSPGSSSSYPIPPVSSGRGQIIPPFPPPNIDSLPPAGLLVGVFSMDSAFERRMLVRTTWASHARSRNGAGDGDGGAGTSRTIVRFVLGQPRKDWEYRIKLEMEMYNDIIVLPQPENMNSGKTYSFFAWASENGWVPPIYVDTISHAPKLSYSNITRTPPPLAPHDPVHAWQDKISHASNGIFKPQPWVRPDYVVKVDDDSFVMLAELESRLRLELHAKAQQNADRFYSPTPLVSQGHPPRTSNTSSTLSDPYIHDPTENEPRAPPDTNDDPLVYWGYLVKNRFMAGELYALSWSLVDWVAKDSVVKSLTRGAEDKQTAKWMRLHPRADEVRWSSERCWIYDHPRAGTVYSHGFLFPSEVTRVRRSIISYLDKTPQDVLGDSSSPWILPVAGSTASTPVAWAYSTVSTFGARYIPPLPDLTTLQSVEALVEGSDMSVIREGSPMTPEYAWLHREGRKKRYENHRVGGTVVVHFIKKNMWFLETALALLEGDDHSEAEQFQRREAERIAQEEAQEPHPAAVDPEVLMKAIQKHRRR